MITSDPLYDALAEIHVPSYCQYMDHFKPGCMLPSAVNYDPEAKEVGECRFKTTGCTAMSALNYNSYATDDDGSCIERKLGCTVNSVSYAGVAADVPEYKKRYWGASAATGGSGGSSVRFPLFGKLYEEHPTDDGNPAPGSATFLGRTHPKGPLLQNSPCDDG